MKKISGNKLLVKALKEEGVDTIFGYPGACTIDISDELYKQDYTKVILPRQEVALVHEADAYARSTGKVGVCLVTSGPGATNLVTGLATAYYDSVPLVCFTGQVARHLIGNDAFQEVDIVGITRSITKYGVTVRNREDLGRIIKEAFYIARSGRPGPVLVDLPKDVMGELGSNEYPQEVNIRGYKPNTHVHIGQLKRAIKMLGKAKKPLFLVGGGVNIARAGEVFTEIVDRTKVPVVTTVMGRGAIPTNHPLYIGNLGMHGAYASNMAVNECDLLFSIGTRFNDRITGKLHSFAPKAQIVHIDIDTAAISKNVQVDVPIVADAKEALEKMVEYVTACDTEEWIAKVESWKEEHPLVMKKKTIMTPEDVIEAINRLFDEAEEYQLLFLCKFFRHRLIKSFSLRRQVDDSWFFIHLLFQRPVTLIHRFCLHKHSGSSAIRIIVHTVMLVKGVIADVDRFNGQKPFIYRPADNACTESLHDHLRK